jgi:hypothetical protein
MPNHATKIGKYVAYLNDNQQVVMLNEDSHPDSFREFAAWMIKNTVPVALSTTEQLVQWVTKWNTASIYQINDGHARGNCREMTRSQLESARDCEYLSPTSRERASRFLQKYDEYSSALARVSLAYANSARNGKHATVREYRFDQISERHSLVEYCREIDRDPARALRDLDIRTTRESRSRTDWATSASTAQPAKDDPTISLRVPRLSGLKSLFGIRQRIERPR